MIEKLRAISNVPSSKLVSHRSELRIMLRPSLFARVALPRSIDGTHGYKDLKEDVIHISPVDIVLAKA